MSEECHADRVVFTLVRLKPGKEDRCEEETQVVVGHIEQPLARWRHSFSHHPNQSRREHVVGRTIDRGLRAHRRLTRESRRSAAYACRLAIAASSSDRKSTRLN